MLIVLPVMRITPVGSEVVKTLPNCFSRSIGVSFFSITIGEKLSRRFITRKVISLEIVSENLMFSAFPSHQYSSTLHSEIARVDVKYFVPSYKENGCKLPFFLHPANVAIMIIVSKNLIISQPPIVRFPHFGRKWICIK